MSNENDNLTISQCATRIGATIQSWVEPRGGTYKLMANMRHLWEEILNPTLIDGKPRVLLICMGEQSRGTFNTSNTLHRVNRQWKCVIIRGHGFKNLLNEEGVEQPEAFYDALEDLRDTLRCMAGVTAEPPITYTGWSPLPNIGPGNVANVFLDALQIEFSVAADVAGILVS